MAVHATRFEPQFIAQQAAANDLHQTPSPNRRLQPGPTVSAIGIAAARGSFAALEADTMFPIRLNNDVALELLEVRHADELFHVTDANRAHLRQWLPWVDGSKSPGDTKAFIQLTRKQLLDNNGFQTAIRLRGTLVGVVGHHRINWANRSTSLGYWLSEDAQGRGIMTEACRAYTSHAFETLKLNRVEIRCAVENRRSRAIPERLAFRSEGTIRQAEWLYDHFVDHVVYGMLATEWGR